MVFPKTFYLYGILSGKRLVLKNIIPGIRKMEIIEK
jgi:hypothetical protein